MPLAVDPAAFPPFPSFRRCILVSSSTLDERAAKMLPRVVAEVRRRDEDAVFLSVDTTSVDSALKLNEQYPELTVDEFERLFSRVTAVLDLSLGGTTLRARLSDGTIPKEGETVFVTARPDDIHLFDAATRKRL
jgi:hypothetical protein